ncbi:hypothetical protein JYP46_21065 [Nitratireductor aquimarinus]|uniref:hypothetical protein n=1 Tax=Alphaproteobacteria TaxID=28211 RepID=UPI0019D3D653|nr:MULTISPECIES: hypothetical protein [Alphaproteobacteria]MBN7759322.1 hypothetical protein [Nitratireductor aquimarinus]MBY6001602.1 hypothetical protein [Tritonibacter mobilis]MBY6023890.1 hypothetical protein [Nitratireductor sp. DP7N14-4]
MGKFAKNRTAFLGALIGGQLIFSASIGLIMGDFGAAVIASFLYVGLVCCAALSWLFIMGGTEG